MATLTAATKPKKVEDLMMIVLEDREVTVKMSTLKPLTGLGLDGRRGAFEGYPWTLYNPSDPVK
jgi:hypothetical protein